MLLQTIFDFVVAFDVTQEACFPVTNQTLRTNWSRICESLKFKSALLRFPSSWNQLRYLIDAINETSDSAGSYYKVLAVLYLMLTCQPCQVDIFSRVYTISSWIIELARRMVDADKCAVCEELNNDLLECMDSWTQFAGHDMQLSFPTRELSSVTMMLHFTASFRLHR